LLKELFPEAQKVAVLYTSSEANSVFQANIAKEAALAIGLETTDATISNSNEIQQVVSSVLESVDAIYAPTDNIIAAAMPTVVLAANEAKIPVICGEEGMVEKGGLITYGINYFNLGKMTGKQAVKVLKGADISAMPIEYLSTVSLETTINKETAAAIGFEFPASILEKAKTVE